MNPLDRSTRNDLNYNFGAIDDNFDNMNVEFHDELKDLDAKLDEMMDGRLIDELYDAAKDARDEAAEAKTKGNYANDRGKYADGRGKYAQTQGDYAKEQGDFAKEKGEETAKLTAKIKEENTDLQNIKNEAIDATQKTKVATQETNEATNKANAATHKANESATNADSQAKHAKEQGDYAKAEADKAKDLTDRMKHIGAWSDSVSYKKDNEVEYDGSTYRAKKDNKGVAPTNESTWQLIALRGVDGKGAVGSVNGKKPTADGNVDLGELVHSVAGVAPNVNGDVALKTENINVIKPVDLTASATEYPIGITVFYKNVPDDNAPSQYGNVLTLKGASATTFQLFAKNGFIPQSEELYYRIHHVTKGWTEWFKIIDSHDLSDSTTSESSDKVATSKAVKYLNDALIGTDDDLREHKLTKGSFDDSGHVQLSNHTNSTSSVSDGVAATPYAVNEVRKLAEQAFQLGVEQKGLMVDSLASRGVDVPSTATWEEIRNATKKMYTLENVFLIAEKGKTELSLPQYALDVSVRQRTSAERYYSYSLSTKENLSVTVRSLDTEDIAFLIKRDGKKITFSKPLPDDMPLSIWMVSEL